MIRAVHLVYEADGTRYETVATRYPGGGFLLVWPMFGWAAAIWHRTTGAPIATFDKRVSDRLPKGADLANIKAAAGLAVDALIRAERFDA